MPARRAKMYKNRRVKSDAALAREINEMAAEQPVRIKINKRQRELEDAYTQGRAAGLREARDEHHRTLGAFNKTMQDELVRTKDEAKNMMVSLLGIFSRQLFMLGQEHPRRGPLVENTDEVDRG